MKNSSDSIGNLTRDLSACDAVSQPTVPPRVPTYTYIYTARNENSAAKTLKNLLQGAESFLRNYPVLS
jgi:hypothetical protein